MPFSTFLWSLIFTPSTFFREHLVPEDTPRPYWRLAVVAFCSDLFIDILETRHNVLPTSYAARLLMVAFVIVPLTYVLRPRLIKLLVALLGGKTSTQQAREIMVYTGLLSVVLGVLMLVGLKLMMSLLLMMPNKRGALMLIGLLGWVLSLLFLLIISYFCYLALRILTGAKRLRTILWCLMVAVFMAARFKLFSELPKFPVKTTPAKDRLVTLHTLPNKKRGPNS